MARGGRGQWIPVFLFLGADTAVPVAKACVHYFLRSREVGYT